MADPETNGQVPEDGGDLIGQVLARIQGWFTSDVMPLINRHTDEQVSAIRADTEARFSAIAERLANQPPPEAANVAAIAGEVGKLLAPEIQGVVNQMSSRIAALETGQGRAGMAQGPASGGQPPSGASSLLTAAGGATPPNGLGGAPVGVGIAALGDALVGLAERLLPLVNTYQSMRSESARNIAWAANLRNTDPITATILAQTLNPDPLGQYVPSLIASGIQQGMKARVIAGQPGAGLMPGMPGGPGWPLTPSSAPIGSPSNVGVPLLPGPSAPMPTPSGASMSGNGGAPPSRGPRSKAGSAATGKGNGPGAARPGTSLAELFGQAA